MSGEPAQKRASGEILASAGPTAPQGGGRWTAVGFVVVPYLLLVALKLFLAWPLDCPLKGDELGYLSNARFLATGGGLIDPEGRAAYKVGYSLWLIPAFRLTADPAVAFKAVQVINAFLLSLVYPAAFLLAGRLRGDLTRFDRMLAAGCVSLYPAALLYATTAMSANVFLPAYFAFLLAALAALSRPRWWTWATFGTTAAYLYAVHERAIGILALALAAAAFHLLRGSGSAAGAAPRRAGALALFAALPLTLGLIGLAEVPGADWQTGSMAGNVLTRALTSPRALAVTFSGQLWYLGLATLGTLFTGTLFLLLARRRPPPLAPLAPISRPPSTPALETGEDAGEAGTVPQLFWWVLYGSAASVFAISVLFMTWRPRAMFTHWVYGRYNEGVLLPLLLVALLALRDAERAGWRKTLAVSCAGGTAAIALLSLVLRLAWSPAIGPPYSFSASSVPIFLELYRRGPAAVLVLGLAFALIPALTAWRWRWGVVALGVFFALSTAVSYRGWAERYRATEGQRELARLIERIAPTSRTIRYDTAVRPFHFHYFNLHYFLPGYSFEPLPEVGEPAGDLVLSRRISFGRAYPEARLAGLENFSRVGTRRIHGLWVLPGSLQDELAERGWLLPAGFPGPLAARSLAAELEVIASGSLPGTLRRGQSMPIELAVSHRARVPWPHAGGLKSRRYPVGVALRWLPAAGKTGSGVSGPAAKPLARQWRDLPRMLYPGETVVLGIRLLAERSLAAGSYQVVVTIAQRLEPASPRYGPDSVELRVEVTE